MKQIYKMLSFFVLSLSLALPAMAALSSDQVLKAVEKVTPATEQAAQKQICCANFGMWKQIILLVNLSTT